MKFWSYDLHENFISISSVNLYISKIIFTYKSRPTILILSTPELIYSAYYRRLYGYSTTICKRDAFANEAAHVLATLQQELHVPATAVQIYERYDVENLSDDALQKAKHLIFLNHLLI